MTDPSSGPASDLAEQEAQRRRLVDQLFDAALDVPVGARRSLLDERCPTTLRPDVERLLAAVGELGEGDAEAETFVREGGALLGAFGSKLADIMDEDAPLELGDVVGPYRVVKELGRGGMAAVYLAERIDGIFDHQVALKVTLNRHRGPRSRARFELERQILAGLRHPNIAQLLDGGVTEAGHPYFVMEWVDGLTIDRYCDEQRLTVRERLRLFLDVGRAVATAHRSLIVHRDLKPNNVLVTADPADGSHRVKLLDFGIAKVLDDEEGTNAFGALGLTRTSMPMTPDYASPEQLLGEPLTTAVDVYQLGLLLFELLCGTHPFGGMSLVERLARDHTPSRPSLLLATAEAHTIAESRSTDLKSLRRQISGDLETIVMTALRTEPERRYSTVKAIVDDIEAYLEDRPIEARADSLAYRTRKFVARNLAATLATTLSLTALVVVVAASMVGLRQERDLAREARLEAERSKAEAEEVVGFLVDLFEVSEGGAVRAESISALDLLKRGSETVDEELSDTPLVRARILATLGRVYNELTLHDEAADYYRRSLDIREAQLGPDTLPVADSLEGLGRALMNGGHRNDALPYQERSVAIRRRLLPPDDPLFADSLETVGTAYWYQGRYQDVEEPLRQALAIRQAAFGETSEETLNLHRKLGILLRTLDRPQEAMFHAQKAIDISLQTLGPDHPNTANTYNTMALLQVYLGLYDEAEANYRRAIDIWTRSMGEYESPVASAVLNLGGLYSRQGRYEEALEAQQQGFEIREAAFGPDHPDVADALSNVSSSLLKLGRYDEALANYQRAIGIFERTDQMDHPQVAWALNGLGQVLSALGRFDEAEDLILRALEIRRQSYGDDNTESAGSHLALGELYQRMGRLDEADEHYLEAVELRYKSGDKAKIRENAEAYAGFLREQGRVAEAEEVLARYASE